MVKLLQVVANNLAKSRAPRDANKKHRRNFRPRQIRLNHLVLVCNHTSKPFEGKNKECIAVNFVGKGRVWVKTVMETSLKLAEKMSHPLKWTSE